MDWIERVPDKAKLVMFIYSVIGMLTIISTITYYMFPNKASAIVLLAFITIGFLMITLGFLMITLWFLFGLFTIIDFSRDIRIREVNVDIENQLQSSDQATQSSRLSIMAFLPPLKSFTCDDNNETTTASSSSAQCAVCLEEFKNGEMIQPFTSCGHEFHTPCIHSWLNGGNITCPICRFSLQDIILTALATTSTTAS